MVQNFVYHFELIFEYTLFTPRSVTCLCLASCTGCHSFQERLVASQEALKNRNVVNLGAIRQGMKRFQFLLNCCEPGTIPDASILAAALDLVSVTVCLCVCVCVCVHVCRHL